MNRQSLLPGLFAALILAGCGASSVPSSNPSTDGLTSGPSLRIMSPKDGDSVQQPVQVVYSISGIDADAVQQYRLQVMVGSPAISTTEVTLTALKGTAALATDKMQTGRRDLIFTLVRADGTGPANPALTVTIRGVTITGGR